MNLQEDFWISIHGTMEAHGQTEPDNVDLMTRGSFREKGDNFYIVYNESEATGYAGCTTTVKISRDGKRAAMLRHGNRPSQLVIEKGVRHLCHYETGYGGLTFGVSADEICYQLNEKGGSLRFSYTLDDGNENLLSRNAVDITVRPIQPQ